MLITGPETFAGCAGAVPVKFIFKFPVFPAPPAVSSDCTTENDDHAASLSGSGALASHEPAGGVPVDVFVTLPDEFVWVRLAPLALLKFSLNSVVVRVPSFNSSAASIFTSPFASIA